MDNLLPYPHCFRPALHRANKTHDAAPVEGTCLELQTEYDRLRIRTFRQRHSKVRARSLHPRDSGNMLDARGSRRSRKALDSLIRCNESYQRLQQYLRRSGSEGWHAQSLGSPRTSRKDVAGYNTKANRSSTHARNTRGSQRGQTNARISSSPIQAFQRSDVSARSSRQDARDSKFGRILSSFQEARRSNTSCYSPSLANALQGRPRIHTRKHEAQYARQSHLQDL